MNKDFEALMGAADDETLDNHRNAPRPDPACLYGLVGDVARAGGDTTEANPFAIAANFIAFMSCAVGRGPFMPVGNTWHHSRQFMLHIGRSGRGRKGDAVSLISRIERALKALSKEATPQVHRGGLSSREGLVYLIHDGFTEGKTEVEAIHDKRLRVELSLDARKRYEKLYLTELNDNSAGDRITALIERRAPMLLRLAMLFALCDQTTTVEVHHINAALSWIRFSVDSIKFIFGSAADEVAVEETNDTATKIVEFLRERGKATRWELTKGCFGGHTSKSRIDAALDELLSSNPPRAVVDEDRSAPGRPTKFYTLTPAKYAKKAKKAKYEHPCGLARIFHIT